MDKLNELIKLLIKKGYITEKEILKIEEELIKEMEKEEKRDFERDLLASAGEAIY